MGAPTVYRWDDTDAPVLTGEVGSLVNLLDKCLVDGYGTKSPLGWTKAFADTNKGAYRNDQDVGCGCFLRVDDSGASGYDHSAHVQAFEAMSDIDTGTGPAPSDGVPDFWTKSNVAGTAVRAWIIIGDSRFFYFIPCVSGSSITATSYTQYLYYCGDMISVVPGDQNYFVIACSYGFSGSYGPYSGHYNNAQSAYVLRDSNGSIPPSGQRMLSGGGLENVSVVGAGGCTYPWLGQVLITRPVIGDGGTLNTFRGFLPGLHSHCHPYGSIDNLIEFTQDGKTFFPIKIRSHNYVASILIDINTSFRP